MDKNWLKKYGTLALLAAGAGIIFQLPYIRETFYVPIMTAMDLSHQQMGILSSGYATMATISYLFGGIIADKFSARKLLTISFLVTGVLGLWFAQFPSFNTARLIFILMGVSTIITFWSALIKATRLLGDSTEQGRLFGLQEGLRGLFNALLVFLMAFVFSKFTNETVGAAWAIRLVAITNIILGILHWIVIEDTEREENTQTFGEIISGFFRSLKIPRVWILVAIVFFAYSLYGLIGYVTTMAVELYGMSNTTAANIGGLRYVIQAFGGVLGGVFADKIGSRIKAIIIGAGLTTLSYGVFYMIPLQESVLPYLILNFVVGMFLIYVIRSQYFAIIDDAGIPVSFTGRVSGTVSAIGYLPDVFMYTMVGNWIDINAGKAGYNMLFVYAMVMGVGAILFSLLLQYVISKKPTVELND